MKQFRKRLFGIVVGASLVTSGTIADVARATPSQDSAATQVDSRSGANDNKDLVTLSREDLVALLKAPKPEQPLVFSVGPKLLYEQAHAPGAEYIGAAGSSQGIEALRARVKSLPRNTLIVIYCGCCPWDRCPNIRPAYRELRSMGFTQVKALLIADNFGADWVYKGYPVVKGE